VEHSSLAERVRELCFKLMVGAFHGHAHNRVCQVWWHPLYMEGTGLFAGEGYKHVFSLSNKIDRSTRHASQFHRLQTILEYFDHWDDNKYAALGKWGLLPRPLH
jgi:hypothetical protein